MKTIGVGTLINDPKLKAVGDTYVCELSVSVYERRKVKDQVKKLSSVFKMTVWDSAAMYIVKYAKNGDRIYVEATPREETWETDGQKRSRVVFRVDSFKLLDYHEEVAE